jgi:hypothetical protein
MIKPSRKKAKPVGIKNPILASDEKPERGRKKKGLPPGRTLESAENQLVGLAVDVARQQMQSGTASAQVIVHFLKLGSSLARLEQEKLTGENELLRAKTESLKSQKKIEDLYLNALQAMRSYSGNTNLPDEASSSEDED